MERSRKFEWGWLESGGHLDIPRWLRYLELVRRVGSGGGGAWEGRWRSREQQHKLSHVSVLLLLPLFLLLLFFLLLLLLLG